MKFSASSLPRAIWALGLTSLFMDVSSEMIHGLLPLYITGTLGAGAIGVGLIEGIAEATALIVKVFSGAVSDITGKRKLIALLGYGLAAITKPLFPLAQSLELIITARFIDRIGKGIRGAPRDALVADIAPKERLGEAYGLRQSLDTIGAFIGPLIAVGVMMSSFDDFRLVFWLAVIPAALSVATLFFFVPEREAPEKGTAKSPITLASIAALPRAYWVLLGIGAIMSLARVSDAFLVLRVANLGLATAYAPLVLVAMNIIYALFAYPAGKLADRVSRKTLLAIGIVALIAADAVLALAPSLGWGGLGLILWGLHMALTQGLLAAMIAAEAPSDLRGTAFGLFNLASGGAMLLGNVAGGLLWDLAGDGVTFLASGIAIGVSFALLPLLRVTR
ncbi:MAG: MFS transporter [Beijerinckiaceae bacterium]|nr:MFS transporter [Beijerinckiaceae bacterium]